MVGTWKVLNKASPGSGTEFGADDTDKINKLLRGDPNVDTAEINSIFRFRDNKLYIRDSLNLFNYIVRTSGIAADKQITLPLLQTDDTFVFNNHAATLAGKNLAGSTIPNYIDISSTSTPANPTSGVLRIYRRTSDNLLVFRNNAGVETAMSGAAGGGETNTASNIGSGGVGIFKQKSVFDLQFKKLNTASGGLITITDDTANNEVDLKITPAGVEGQYLRTVGGVPVWDKPGMVMPDGSFYTGNRWGIMPGGGANGDGYFAGALTNGTVSYAHGTSATRTIFTSAAVDQSLGGWESNGLHTRTSQKPRIKGRIAPSISTERTWFGFISASPYPKTLHPMDNRSGVMVGFSEIETNWVVKWNNGAASSQTTSTGIAKDANLHIVEIILDDPGVTVKFDGNTIVNASTTAAPATGTTLSTFCYSEAVGATAIGMGYEYAMLTF